MIELSLISEEEQDHKFNNINKRDKDNVENLNKSDDFKKH